MVLHDARRDTRVDDRGELVLLEDQDRSRWDDDAIAEGVALVERARQHGAGAGPYVLQAAIAAEHGRAVTPEDTDWHRIAALYDELMAIAPSPVVALNRAVAVAMDDGAAAGLVLVDALAEPLSGYHLWHSARADLLRRLGRRDAAAVAYGRALELAGNPVERGFLERRLRELEAA